MKRTILTGLGLLILLSPQAFAGEQDEPIGRLERYGRLKYNNDGIERYGRQYDEPSVVRGKRGRKYARRFSFGQNLRNDKLRIYDEYGYTPHRLGFKSGGRRTERWKYYEEGLEFLFDGEGNLLKTRRFPRQGNHID